MVNDEKGSGTYRPRACCRPVGVVTLAPAADLNGSMFMGEAVCKHRLGRAVDGFT
jgi:hypothetical protein